jgi:hypothetical protein
VAFCWEAAGAKAAAEPAKRARMVNFILICLFECLCFDDCLDYEKHRDLGDFCLYQVDACCEVTRKQSVMFSHRLRLIHQSYRNDQTTKKVRSSSYEVLISTLWMLVGQSESCIAFLVSYIRRLHVTEDAVLL